MKLKTLDGLDQAEQFRRVAEALTRGPKQGGIGIARARALAKDLKWSDEFTARLNHLEVGVPAYGGQTKGGAADRVPPSEKSVLAAQSARARAVAAEKKKVLLSLDELQQLLKGPRAVIGEKGTLTSTFPGGGGATEPFRWRSSFTGEDRPLRSSPGERPPEVVAVQESHTASITRAMTEDEVRRTTVGELTDEQLKTLTALLNEVRRYFSSHGHADKGLAVDWTVRDGVVTLIQVRPLT